MKVLHIINDKPTGLSKKIIDAQSKAHEVKVIELSKKKVSYEKIVDEIFSHDRVISW
ncbi:MAG: hypothetical protein HZB61_06075 [Nitrospirae bacterium]|nr:hypothetical protein [Nitrospirota bacterium]